MAFALPLTTAPMEARQVETVPTGGEWQYEPKWDGFRCLAFCDGDRVELRSKAGKPLTRYFPDVAAAVGALRLGHAVLDGEVVVPDQGGEGDALSFNQLLQRIHPAESRVRALAASHPALYIAFDLLATPRGRSLIDAPLADRREALTELAASHFPPVPHRAASIHDWVAHTQVALSPVTRDAAQVQKWLASRRGGLDGIVAKRVDLPYESGERTGMVKVKAVRTADCVVGGFRYGKAGRTVGSLLLGLYSDDGLLHHVGFSSALKREERAALTPKLEALERPPGFTGQAPGGPSRWSTERSAEWHPLEPSLVVEVTYDHFSDGRFRHGTGFVRWRPEKAPRQCTMDQIAAEGATALKLLASATPSAG